MVVKTLLRPDLCRSVKKTAIIVLAALLILAGCSSQSAPANNTQTSGSVSLDDVSFPPGVTQSGIQDVDALLRAHRNAIATTDYRVSAHRSYMVTFSDGEKKRFQTWTTTKSDRNDKRAKTIHKRKGRVGGGKNGTYTVYSANGTHYQRANLYFSRRYTTKKYQTTFGQMHNSTAYLNRSLNRTLSNGTLTPVEAFSDGDDSFIRFRISFPGRDVSDGTVIIRSDGLITRVHAPDGSTFGNINDGVDRYSLTVRKDVDIKSVSWKDKARRGVHEHLRDAPTIGDSGGSACNNDGDQSYNEDNDLDNDGICDEE